MLVYGDRTTPTDARETQARLLDLLAAARAAPLGLARHAALVSAFIHAGELAQGLADADFAAHGADRRTPETDAAMAHLVRLAHALRISWATRFRRTPIPPDPSTLAPATPLQLRTPEGYAHYALYPETYLAAVPDFLRNRHLKPVGIRSIGTGLAAIVAAAARLREPPVTVRPTGHPFARTLNLSPQLAAELQPQATYAIADEGPGLSGSSLAAVITALTDRGVAPSRIHLFPSHANPPGAQASPATRALYAACPRHHAPFEQVILPHLPAWFSKALGEPVLDLTDLSGGAWRAHRYASSADWPPANAQQERRKYLVTTPSGRFLARFAGLGGAGETAHTHHDLLAAAGFTPAPVAHVHGFTLTRWHDPAPPPRPTLDQLARYLAFRATHLLASSHDGAPLAELAAMARANITQALGEAAARPLENLPTSQLKLRPVFTDSRLHAWEWITTPAGLLKTDAVDHARAHDLVGAQDIAWDIAGASVELGHDATTVAQAVARLTAKPIDPRLLAFYGVAYPAFQLGLWTLAAEAQQGEDATRARAQAARYAAHLPLALSRTRERVG